ncbi:MAG: arginine--tRNA ligase [Candidatus Heimdallarchaeota archaeon]|nr:arginine--tRNA ligase [Candidatus Heimdallarchaeota archaeon]
MYDQYAQIIEEELITYNISTQISLMDPPSPDLGDFCIVVNKFAGKENPEALGSKLSEMKIKGIKHIQPFITGANKKRPIVYLNFQLEEEQKRRLQTEYIENHLTLVLDEHYGWLDLNKGKSVVVEHTSANPISPLHVGNIRNSILGDTLARILEHTGYTVYRHFYVNDVGLQVSFVVIGYEIAKKAGVRPTIKIDLWMGQVYAIMNCLYTIQTIKKRGQEYKLDVENGYRLSELELKLLTGYYKTRIDELAGKLKGLETIDKPDKDEKMQIREFKKEMKTYQDQHDDAVKYYHTFDSLSERFPDLFPVLLDGVSQIDLIKQQSSYLKAYEKNSNQRVVKLFKEVTLWILDAFQWTLNRYNIKFDQFDYESELSWSGLPAELIDKLAESEFARSTGELGVRLSYPQESINKLLKETGMTKKDLPIRGQVPDLQLRRSNGTSLYAAKDIAYSVKKFKDRNPEYVYNVISTEQSLAQFQLLLPLLELGYPEYAKGLKHYAYELVELSGRPMSGRMAAYVTADAFYDETMVRSRMAKRESDAKRDIKPPVSNEEWKKENEILHAVTLASTRFPLVDKSPSKKIVLDIDQALDFRRNSGPFIQYAHARCCGILSNAEEQGYDCEDDIHWELLADDMILDILKHLIAIEDTILKSWQNLDPSTIATWTFQLAHLFMKFYEAFPVLKAENENLLCARLQVIKAIKKGIAIGLNMLGIPPTDRL